MHGATLKIKSYFSTSIFANVLAGISKISDSRADYNDRARKAKPSLSAHPSVGLSSKVAFCQLLLPFLKCYQSLFATHTRRPQSNNDCWKQRNILERAQAVRKRRASRFAVRGHTYLYRARYIRSTHQPLILKLLTYGKQHRVVG
jgi:hypothetical protein